jgi:ATP-binding cassette subfamily B protein
MNQYISDQEFETKRALWPFLKRIFGYSMRYKKWFLLFTISTIIVGVVDALFPLVWLNFIDHAITPAIGTYQENGELSVSATASMYKYLWFYVGLGVTQMLGVGVFIYCAGQIQENVIFDLRKDMFNRLQELSFSYYDKSAIGWLISRITSDTDRVAELISWGFLSLVWGIVMIIACFTAMFFYNWKLALVVMLTIPLLFLVSVKIRMLVLKYSRKARKLNSDLTANINENINGLEVNKVTSQEERANAAFEAMSEKMRKTSFRSAYYASMYVPIVIMVGSLAAAVVIVFGGHLVLAASTGITLGTLAAFFGYSRIIFEPILDITHFYAIAQNSLSAGERIFSLIDEKPEIKDKEGATAFGEIKGTIEFKNLDFHYNADKPILQGFNLNIKAGESVALVGPTGEGKSTIASLVSRFYEPVNGELLIDGIDYREKTERSFREQLGIIMQTPHLFSGTVRENMKYGHQEATEEMITSTLKLIGATDLIDRLDEEVGDEGSNISTGEKQLISFVRVILKDPKILIMDEATSSVDTIAEMKIQRGIEQLIKSRTSIIIAHRLSTIRNCDRILVIKKGSVLEEGTHDELMKLQGFYHHLYTRQSRSKVA